MVLLQSRPGTIESAVYTMNCRIEEVGHFVCMPAQYVTQDKHCPLAARQVLEGDKKGQGYAFVGFVARGRVRGGPWVNERVG